MITPSASDPTLGVTTGTTAVPLVDGLPPPMLEQSSGAAASMQKPDARERIHRLAGMVHRAIDSLEQSLTSKGGQVTSVQAKYGQQARQYGDKLRQQMTTSPMQSAGIALAAGVILDKLFFRRAPKVRVVKVPVPVRTPSPVAIGYPERRAASPLRTAEYGMQRLGDVGQQAVGKVGAAASLGLAGTRAVASTLTREASLVPERMRLAVQRLLATSQQYGSVARSGVQAHPMMGLGAVLGLSGLLTTLWMRRQPATTTGTTAYVTVDDKGNGLAWQRDRPDVQARARDMVASRPVASAAVVLGLGALVAAMLRRR